MDFEWVVVEHAGLVFLFFVEPSVEGFESRGSDGFCAIGGKKSHIQLILGLFFLSSSPSASRIFLSCSFLAIRQSYSACFSTAASSARAFLLELFELAADVREAAREGAVECWPTKLGVVFGSVGL